MQSLAICNTPFQIFNIINALINQVEGLSNTDTDILIDMTFDSAKNTGVRIEELGLCRKVFYVKKKDDFSTISKLQSLIDIIKDEMHEDMFDFSDVSVINNHYDNIWVGDQNVFGLLAFRSNPHAKVFWYDDGTSSYSTTPESYGHKNLYNFFGKIFKLGCYRYRSRTVYLNNTEVVQYNGYDLRQLPKFKDNNAAVKYLNSIFDYKESQSKISDFKVVILTQVHPASAGYKGMDVQSLFLAQDMDFSKILIRKHPRDTMIYSGCEIDDGKNMWEMECLNSIRDDHILISCCSTAQLTPKIVGGKEPYIFFLHRFLLDDESAIKKGLENMIENLTALYSDKSKILIPNSVEEFNALYFKISALI